MNLSPQSQAVYQTLLRNGDTLTAKQLADELKISPATLYRLTNPLIATGLISKTDAYPYKFSAKPINEGLSLFLLSQNDWFSKRFTSENKDGNKENKNSKEIKLSFVQSRDELMKYAADETTNSTKSVDLLRSGHEMSADVMAEIVNAHKRGITTRMLIQDYSEENAEQVSYWQKNGILVRKTPLRHVRLMIFDASTVYFMSYKHSDSEKDLGMKINYPPFAVIFSQLFDKWWEEAGIL